MHRIICLNHVHDFMGILIQITDLILLEHTSMLIIKFAFPKILNNHHKLMTNFYLYILRPLFCFNQVYKIKILIFFKRLKKRVPKIKKKNQNSNN